MGMGMGMGLRRTLCALGLALGLVPGGAALPASAVLAASPDEPAAPPPAPPAAPPTAPPAAPPTAPRAAPPAAPEMALAPPPPAPAREVLPLSPPIPQCAEPARVTCAPAAWACCPGFVSTGFSMVPGLGAQVLFGRRLGLAGDVERAWEIGFAFQDQPASFNGESAGGKLYLGMLGLRWRSNTCVHGPHLVGRVGLAAFDISGRPDTIDLGLVDIERAGFHLGAYVGIGLDFDMGRGWSTGPEARFVLARNLDADEWSSTPLLAWNVTVTF